MRHSSDKNLLQAVQTYTEGSSGFEITLWVWGGGGGGGNNGIVLFQAFGVHDNSHVFAENFNCSFV